MSLIIPVNGLNIWVETFGKPSDNPLLLIMGGGCHGTMWPDEFCHLLVKKNFYVIRFDHRDVGLSTVINYNLQPYDLIDMAKDVIGILDYFKIEKANVFAVSMGGLISQILAALFPNRVSSLTLMATSLDFSPLIDTVEGKETKSLLSKPLKSYVDWLKSILISPPQTDLEKIQRHLEGWKVLNGNVIEFDEHLYKEMLIKQLNRTKTVNSFIHHAQAIKATLAKIPGIHESIIAKTTIIHGTEDPIFPQDHGKMLADSIRNANFHLINGMGHNINTNFYNNLIATIQKMAS